MGKPVDVGNPLAESPTDEKKVMAAKQIQNVWKQQKRLEKDSCLMTLKFQLSCQRMMNVDTNHLTMKVYPIKWIERLRIVLNMEESVGDLENGIVIFIHPYDEIHAVKASAEVSDDSGDETEDL